MLQKSSWQPGSIGGSGTVGEPLRSINSPHGILCFYGSVIQSMAELFLCFLYFKESPISQNKHKASHPQQHSVRSTRQVKIQNKKYYSEAKVENVASQSENKRGVSRGGSIPIGHYKFYLTDLKDENYLDRKRRSNSLYLTVL